MDHARARYESKELDCWMLRRQKRLWKLRFKKAEKARLAQRKKIGKLRKTVIELTSQTEELETRVEDLEEEAIELRKENEALEDNEADTYHMDLEDDDPSDHDKADHEESEHEPLLPSEEEEDPEEHVLGSGTDSNAVEVPEDP